MKMNELLLYTTWMTLINIILRKKPDTKEYTIYDSIYIKYRYRQN